MNLPHEFIFVFIQYFDGAILSEKSCIKWEARGKGGGGVRVGRNTKMGIAI